mgnify:CR=1 FL=1
MAKQNNMTEDFFKNKGYTQNKDGSWQPPAIKSNYIRAQKAKNLLEEIELVVKEKVNNSPDFKSAPVTEWFIPYQIPSKKNCRLVFVHPKTKKLMNLPSAKYTEYKNVTKSYWTTFGKEFKATIEKLDLKFPLNIEMTFIRSTNQLVDYFGPAESVFDLMTDFGWWEDDNRRFGKPFFADMQVDKNNPGVKIRIMLTK